MLRCEVYVLILIAVLWSIVVVAVDPYCHFNESNMKQRSVLKTRQVVKEPTGFLRKLKTTKSYTEIHIVLEPYESWHLVRRCCKGYELSKLKLCEPVCEQGCPEHARCLEPNICECRKSYILVTAPNSGIRSCKPICELDCPQNGLCVAPNVCECEQGYYVEKEKCVPYCSSGCPNQGVCMLPEMCECRAGYRTEAGTCKPVCSGGADCRNGRCVGPEQCVCRLGFIRQPESGICTAASAQETTADPMGYENNSSESTAGYETNPEQSWMFELTPEFEHSGEKYTELRAKNDFFTESTLKSSTHMCPVGFLYYRGDCLAQIIVSIGIDCHYKACTEHAHCLENGSCACDSGYVWYRKSLLVKENPVVMTVSVESSMYEETTGYTETTEHTDTTDHTDSKEAEGTMKTAEAPKHTLFTEPVCISLLQLDILLGHSPTSAATEQRSSMLIYFCIASSAFCFLVVAVLLGWKFIHRHSGSTKVNAKSDPFYMYENECFSENPEVY